MSIITIIPLGIQNKKRDYCFLGKNRNKNKRKDVGPFFKKNIL